MSSQKESSQDFIFVSVHERIEALLDACKVDDEVDYVKVLVRHQDGTVQETSRTFLRGGIPAPKRQKIARQNATVK